MFHAIAAPARRAILDELVARDGQTLFELCARLTASHEMGLSRQAISQHIDVLEEAGLVRTERQSRYKFHYVDTTPLQALLERWPSRDLREHEMRINLTSVFVDDQAKALAFYTDVLGFVKKNEIDLGGAFWLTVVSPDDPDGTELLLEPSDHPAVGPYRDALVSDGIPLASFAVDDVHAEHERLAGTGVVFTQKPMEMGLVTTAVFDDTCGNLIQIASPN